MSFSSCAPRRQQKDLANRVMVLLLPPCLFLQRHCTSGTFSAFEKEAFTYDMTARLETLGSNTFKTSSMGWLSEVALQYTNLSLDHFRNPFFIITPLAYPGYIYPSPSTPHSLSCTIGLQFSFTKKEVPSLYVVLPLCQKVTFTTSQERTVLPRHQKRYHRECMARPLQNRLIQDCRYIRRRKCPKPRSADLKQFAPLSATVMPRGETPRDMRHSGVNEPKENGDEVRKRTEKR
jgi:hypothetical protein